MKCFVNVCRDIFGTSADGSAFGFCWPRIIKSLIISWNAGEQIRLWYSLFFPINFIIDSFIGRNVDWFCGLKYFSISEDLHSWESYNSGSFKYWSFLTSKTHSSQWTFFRKNKENSRTSWLFIWILRIEIRNSCI